jgi:hypothetical protein
MAPDAPRREIGWEEFGGLCKELARDIATRGPLLTVALARREPGFKPDVCALTATAVDKVAFPWGREELVAGRFTLRKL